MAKRTSLQFLKYADDVKTYLANDIIFREGEPGHLMFVIKAGKVDLRVAGRSVEVLESGGILGEMALVDKGPRSASAVALTDCQLVTLDEDQFQFLIKQTPYFALDVLHVMAERLRNMNRMTTVIRRKMDGPAKQQGVRGQG